MKSTSKQLKSAQVVFGIGMSLIPCATLAQTTKPPTTAKSTISITFTRIPSAGPGENSFGVIAGSVKGAPQDSKIVIYSLGDMWYVQPYIVSPFTTIGTDGKWSATIHGGYAFAVLIVKPGYEPPATLFSLPEAKGKILAIQQANRKP